MSNIISGGSRGGAPNAQAPPFYLAEYLPSLSSLGFAPSHSRCASQLMLNQQRTLSEATEGMKRSCPGGQPGPNRHILGKLWVCLHN